MTIAKRLKLNTLIVSVLLVANAAVATFLVRQILGDVQQLTEVEEPLEQAILEMEINAGETARSVLSYVLSHKESDLDIILDSERDFEQFATEFERLAETQEERSLGAQVADIYAEFKTLGDEITSMSKQRFDDIKEHHKRVLEIDELIDQELQLAINRTTVDAFDKLEEALEMEINIDEAFAGIESYITEPSPETRQTIADSILDFERFATQYQAHALSANERDVLFRVIDSFSEAVTAGNEIIDLTDDLNLKLEMFQEDLVEMDRILDDEIQPLIEFEILSAGKAAQRSGQVAITFVFVSGLIVFALVFGVGRTVSKRIADSATRLGKGAEEFGRGNFDHRIEMMTEDELGALASTFNEMADERMQMEGELKKAHEELEDRVRRRTAELRAANSELEAFAYSVSHDLRAPLRGIDGFSQALLEDYGDKFDEQGTNYLNRVRTATQRMGDLIDGLLELSQVTRSELRRKSVDLSAMAEGFVEDLNSAYLGHTVKLVVQPDIVVQGDSKLLRFVMYNLLANGWKFTRNCEQAQVEFGCHVRDGETEYFVRDNGVGFDPVYVDKLFGAFQRLHSSAEYPGLGIGLAIVQRVIHRHGGSVRAEGAVDQGATFYFTVGSDGGSGGSETP